VLVADSDNGRILVLRVSDGHLMRMFGEHQLEEPSGICVTTTAPVRVVVTDTELHAVLVFRLDDGSRPLWLPSFFLFFFLALIPYNLFDAFV
jgi:hypothetical protein